MPTFEFTSPDGKTYDIDGPDGATQDQAFQMLQQHLGTGQQQQGNDFNSALDNMLSTDGQTQGQSVPSNNTATTQPQQQTEPAGFWKTITDPNTYEREVVPGVKRVNGGLASLYRNVTYQKTDKDLQEEYIKTTGDQLKQLQDQGLGDSDQYKALDAKYQQVQMLLQDDNKKMTLQDTWNNLKNVPSAMRTAFQNDFGGTVARFGANLISDPELLITPAGWEGAATKAALVAAKVAPKAEMFAKAAGVAGGVAGTATVGAALGASISVQEQLDQKGEVNTQQVVDDAVQTGANMAMLTGVGKGLGLFMRSFKKAGTISDEGITSKLAEDMRNGKSVDQATNDTLDSMGLDPREKDDAATHIKSGIVDETNDLYKSLVVAKSKQVKDIFQQAKDRGPGAMAVNPADLSQIMDRRWNRESGDVAPEGNASEPLPDTSIPASTPEEAPVVNPQDGSGTATGSLNRQSGEADPRILAALGLAGTTAAGAYLLGTKPEDIAKYTLGAAAIALGGRALFKYSKGALDIARQIAAKDTGYRVTDLLDTWDRNTEGGKLANMRIQAAQKAVVPDTDRGIAIRRYLQGDKTVTLSPVEKNVADNIRSRYDELGKLAMEHGVIEDMLPDYVTGIYKNTGKDSKGLINDFLDSAKRTGLNMSSKTPFALDKFFKTYEVAAREKGLQAAYEHPADILKVYSDSVTRAIENKKLLNALKDSVFPDGNNPIMTYNKAPKDWSTIPHPQLMGYKVHPDILPSLKHVFAYHDPSLMFRAMQSLNFAVKRMAVSLSGFHLNALGESGLFGGINPVTAWRNGRELLLNGKILRVGGKALSYNGKMADGVDILVRNGLKVGTEDIGGSTYEPFVRFMGKVADDIVPVGNVGSKAAEGVIKLNKVMDHVTWDMAHTGIKLTVGLKELEKMIQQNMDAHAADPRVPLKSLDEMAQHVSSYVNDIAGGLDWRRAAEGIQNKFGRKLALQAFSPVGRQWMQLLMFAPDWTLSNIRAAVKAIPGVTSSDIAKLHRAYVLRGAIYYAIAGNALNVAFSGHPWWDNKDPTQIELGDGRHLLFSKHLIEPVRWLPFVGKPMQEALNKLAFLPKEVISQLTNKEYLSSNNTAPPMTRETDKWYKQTYERLGHIAKQFTPISGQQLSQQGPGGVMGFLGHPIYGRTEEQKAQVQMAKDMDFSTAVDNMFNQSMGK